MHSRLTRSTCPATLVCALAIAALATMLGVPKAAATGAPASPASAPAAYAYAAQPEQAQKFSLDFIDTDLMDVIKALAQQSGANIAVSGKVQGKITLHLSNVSLEQALTIVTKLGGVDYAKVDSTYVVGSAEEVQSLKAASYTSRVVSLKHISPDYARGILGKVTPDVSVSSQPGTTAVVLVGPADALGRAERALTEADVPSPEAPPVTEAVSLKYLSADETADLLKTSAPKVEVSAGATGTVVLTGNGADVAAAKALLASMDVIPAAGVAENMAYVVKYAQPDELKDVLTKLVPGLLVTLGPRTVTPFVTPPTGGAATGGGLAYLSGAQLQAQTGGATAGTASLASSPVTMIILSGSKSLLARALELLPVLDMPPRQVRIKVTITEVSRTAESRLGINWQDLAGAAGVVLGEMPEGEIGDTHNSRDIKLGHFSRSNLQIAGALNALITEGNARILANPTIAMLDGREATIHSGDKIYYPQVIGFTPLGGQIVQATEIDVGVTLKVNPRIGPDGTVTLTVLPSVSSIAPSVFSGYPTITERSAVTTVRVKDGETFVLGGLIRDDEIIIVNKVPLLGDIPVIGDLLFKSKDRKPSHSEVLVIITPEVVKDAA